MNQAHFIITHGPSRLRGAISDILAFLIASALLPNSAPADMYQPKVTPGGISPQPWITSFSHRGTNTTLSWYGLAGGYNILMTPTLCPPQWTNVASPLATTYLNSLTMANLPGSQNFFESHQQLRRFGDLQQLPP
jgi:hypothetical protein